MRVLISTGEVSGDVAGALVAKEILRRDPAAHLFGIGGARLQQAGVDIAFSTIHLGTVGVSESLAAIPALFQAIRIIRRRVASDRPDVALLIGNDIFNVILGRWLRARGIPTISWFPPQVWIWRSLAWLFTKSFDAVLASFPDEQRVYEKHCPATTFVGHYLADNLSPATPHERALARSKFGLHAEESVVAILPGSRRQELKTLIHHFLDAASILAAERPVRFLLPVSDACFQESIRTQIARRGLSGRVTLVERDSHDVMRASDVILTASGTATLEATLLGVPMVVAYRVSAVTLFIVRLAIRAGLMDAETTALPNLVLGREAVTELKQRDVGPVRIAEAVKSLLDDGFARRKTVRDLATAAAELRAHDSVGQVATIVLGRASRDAHISPIRTAAGHQESLHES